jgi:hypothetical protein
MVLSVIPCSDAHNECISGAKDSQTQNHNHNQDKDDNCSPFCICSCCGSSIQITTIQTSEICNEIEFIIRETKFNQDFSFISNFHTNIWQPPKIS